MNEYRIYKIRSLQEMENDQSIKNTFNTFYHTPHCDKNVTIRLEKAKLFNTEQLLQKYKIKCDLCRKTKTLYRNKYGDIFYEYMIESTFLTEDDFKI